MKHSLWPALLLALLITPAWSQSTAPQDGAITACIPNAQAPAREQPYEGYAATGYKGALERDKTWFAAVRAVARPDGRQRYVFRHAQSAQRQSYESIETLSLGGKSMGFAAYNQGCGELFDARGRSLGVPAFEAIADAYTAHETPHSVLLERKLTVATAQGTETAFSYLRFTKGKLAASSPHQYRSSYSSATIPSANTELQATGLHVVAISEHHGVGLLDLSSLREVLAPRWQAVGQITDFMRRNYSSQQPLSSYLLARDANGLQLHTMDGQAIALPHFDRISFVHGWYPRDQAMRPSGSDPLVIQTQEASGHENTDAGPCRLYNEALQPLLDHALPASACLRSNEEAKPFFAYSVDGLTQVYRKRLTPQQHLALERSATNVAGRLLHMLDNGSLLLQSAQQPPYRLATPQGQDIPERGFDGFQNLGCDFLLLRRGEQRWMLNQDGSLSPGMRYPFSC